jgi:hypothetical protein
MRFSSFSEIRTGHAFRERLLDDPDGNVSVIQPKDIQRDGTVSFLEGRSLRTGVSSPRTLKQDEVLVVNRARIAAAVFDFSPEDRWIVPSSIMVLTLRRDIVLPQYIAIYLNSPEGQRMFRRHFEHSTIPFISTGNFGSMDVPVPPLDRQIALIEYHEMTRKYKVLTQRKHELLAQVLSHELTSTATAMGGSER